MCCMAIILSVILIPMSLNTIEADEIGIAYDHLTEELSLNSEGKAYTEGRYVLTPASEFLTYKRTLQTLDYETDPIKCLSAEGLQMELRITLQYQIIQDDVMKILTNYGFETEWKEFLHSIAKDSLKDICSKYYAADYFNMRADIEKDLFNTTREYFQLSNAYAMVELVNLRNVKHPAFFVSANEDKQEIEQEKNRLLREREDLITKETTILLKTREETKIKLINANATSKAVIEKAQSLVSGILGQAEALGPAIIQKANDLAPAENNKWDARGQAFLNIWSQMGKDVSIDQFIDEYYRYRVLTSQGEKKIISLPLEQAQASLLNLLVAKI